MTPLGQQIARLLAPEHWTEWRIIQCGLTAVKHDGRDILIGPLDGDFSVSVVLGVVGVTTRLGKWERRKIGKLATRLVQTVQGDARKAAEERAIEELLKS